MDPGGEVKKQGLEPIEILRSRPLSIVDGPLHAGITDDHRMGLEAPTSMKCPIHRAAKEQVLGCSGDTLQANNNGVQMCFFCIHGIARSNSYPLYCTFDFPSLLRTSLSNHILLFKAIKTALRSDRFQCLSIRYVGHICS